MGISSVTMGSSIDLTVLLAHRNWLHALSLELVGDRQRADDVVQDTLVSALEQPGNADWDVRRIRAWLAQVARNFARMSLRSEERRRRRELARARPEAQPSASESLELLELQEQTAAAVIALGSPDSEIIALRYFEGLPPREIARRLDLTPSAVHSRLTRARAALRERLEQKYNERGENWSAVALVWAARPGVECLVAPATVAGGILMKNLMVAAGVAALTLLTFSGGHWLRSTRNALPLTPERVVLDRPQAVAETAVSPALSVSDDATRTRVPLPRKRLEPVAAAEPAPALSEPVMGTIRVTVVDEHGEPAPDIGLSLRAGSRSEGLFREQRGVTDAQGIAEFRTAPGQASVEVRRAIMLARPGKLDVDVVAGEASELSFQLADGISIRGRVVDWTGRFVEGAEIWLGDGLGVPSGGGVVAHSDQNGHFELLHASSIQYVAARASGYAPTPIFMPTFFAEQVGEATHYFIELLLPAPGGALDGLVVDARGAPVEDALVHVGNGVIGRLGMTEGTPTWDPPLISVRTDAEGRFHADGLVAGEVRVRARAPGTDLGAVMATVPVGGVGTVRIVVGDASRVVGVVRRADGAVVAGAELAAGIDGEALSWAWTLSDEEGRFEFDGLPVGYLTLTAKVSSEGLAVRHELETLAGTEERWDAYFPDALVLTGTLVDEHDALLAGWFIRREATDVGAAQGEMGKSHTTTDSDGQFRFEGCPAGPQKLTVRAPGQVLSDPIAERVDVLPGGDSVTLRVLHEDVPRGALTGRVVDAQGLAIPGAKLTLLLSHPRFVGLAEHTDSNGMFRFAYLPAGEYRLILVADGFEAREWKPLEEIGDGEQRDLGLLELEPAD